MAELVIALDVPEAPQAVVLAERLEDRVKWLKVGLELFTSAGPAVVDKLKAMGFNIFLDLKYYDIPHTVEKAVAAAARLHVDMISIHCQGGQRMCEAAVEAGHGGNCLVFGVTALTSFAAGEMPGIRSDPGDYGRELAAMAWQWGMDGVVCSAHEVAPIKRSSPGLLCLCPGIRLAAGDDDQRRISSPSMAVRAGADFLVVGRPVIHTSDPAAMALSILESMDGAS